MAGRLTQKILGHIGPLLSGGGGDGQQTALISTSPVPSPHPHPPLGTDIGLWKVDTNETVLHPWGGTYPRLCRLTDGALLAVSTAFPGPGQHVLQVSRSVDGGRTFLPHGEIARGVGDIDNGFLIEVPPSPSTPRNHPVVLAAFRNHDRPLGGQPTHFRIVSCLPTYPPYLPLVISSFLSKRAMPSRIKRKLANP